MSDASDDHAEMYAITVRFQARDAPRRSREPALRGGGIGQGGLHHTLRLLLAAVVIAASLWPQPAAAQVRDGAALLRECTATIGAFVDYCYGYIDAVADYLFQNHAIGEFSACVTRPPDDSQLRFVVVQFLRANPALGYESAPELIARALSEKFPCKQPVP